MMDVLDGKTKSEREMFWRLMENDAKEREGCGGLEKCSVM
jgi:hypothetical protein